MLITTINALRVCFMQEPSAGSTSANGAASGNTARHKVSRLGEVVWCDSPHEENQRLLARGVQQRVFIKPHRYSC